MSKHLTGSKRLQVIQNWLNGRDDPEWDVLPTKKENKYIVKRRTEPLSKPQAEPQVEEQEVEEPAEEPTKPLPTCSQGKVCSAKKIERTKPQSNNSAIFDPTINMEILNQLKLLGEEIKSKREKKEQKRMIKEVMNKELYKRNQYTQPQAELESCYRKPLALQQESAKLPQYIQQPNELESDDEEPEPVPPRQQLSRRRNNIFSDIY